MEQQVDLIEVLGEIEETAREENDCHFAGIVGQIREILMAKQAK